MEALATQTPEPTADACQVPTFKAADAPSDCFNGSGEPAGCAGVDLAGVEAGLLTSVPEVADEPNLPTGFVVTFAEPPEAAEEFVLSLYLDLDEDPTTGLDMSSGASALPGIDRLIGVSLPSGEAWTQAVANGGQGAEIVRDQAQISARLVGDKVIVSVARALLTDASVGAGKDGPPAAGPLVPVGYSLRVNAAGALPDAFTLYAGTARDTSALDFFNGDLDIHAPLAMTVPEDALYPPCPGGS
jgi:hypothetical protein